jgi:energy-coupling factor transporter transmembrane protein EcfT
MACECGSCGHSVNGFSKFLKYLFLIINLIFFILGIIVLAVGAYAMTVNTSIPEANYSVQYPIGFIVLGAIVAVFAFFGCCGAWKESKLLLSIYAIIMALLLIAQIAIVAYAASQGDKYISDAWGDSTLEQRSVFQNDSNCCGYANPSDRPGPDCLPTATEGCKTKYLSNTDQVIIAGAVLLAIEIIGFIISIIVCCHIHSKPSNANEPKIQ